MYTPKEPREETNASQMSEEISCFEGESRVSQNNASFFESIGVKGFQEKGRYFSIDFTDASIRKGDHCKYNKTSEMRVDEFWEELTAASRDSISRIVSEAKLRGLSSLKDKLQALRIMFKKPDIVLGLPSIQHSSFINNCFSNIALNQNKAEIYFSDFCKTYKLVGDPSRKSADIHRVKYLEKPLASLCVHPDQSNLLCGAPISSGQMIVWDHNVGKELITYSFGSHKSTASHITVKNELVATLDDSKQIHIFDLRCSNPVHQINCFKNAAGSILSMQMDFNEILLGTSDGPILLPVNFKQDLPADLSTADPYKSRFITKEVLVSAQIGSEDLTFLNSTTGATSILNIPEEQIVDFEVSPTADIVSVVSTHATSNKHYLRTIKRQPDGFDWDQYLKLPRMPYRVGFSRPDELLVVDESYFSTFGTSNLQFVNALKEKLARYLR